MYERIDLLVTKHGCSFQAWNDRYSRGVWAALGTLESEVDVVRDLTNADDLTSTQAVVYIQSAQWLPYAIGRTLLDAMSHLESILGALPSDQLARGTDWFCMVHDRIEALRQVLHAEGGLPTTFDAARTSK